MTHIHIRVPPAGPTIAVHPLLLVLAGGVFVGTWWPLAALGLLSPLATFGVSLTALFATIVLWEYYIKLSPDEREDDQYPRTYTRQREFQGYRITVDVREYCPSDDERGDDVYRTVHATAFDGDEEIASAKQGEYAGSLPRTVFDSPVGEGRGMSAGTQTQIVLEDLYEDILTYDATGSVEETSGVDSALDTVFGEAA